MTHNADVTIIGAGLTGLTLAFYLHKQGKKVLLIDKNEKAGGVINTEHVDGFSFETGPNTGTLSSPELVQLFKDLDDKCELSVANPDSKKRWIWKKDKWHCLPSGLMGGIRTPLFSWYDKFRILGEPFRRKGSDPFESVAGMVRRRMGESYLKYAVDPFVSGIYAGDPENLVTRFALPKLYQLEQKYGSFIKGAIKKGKEPKTDLEKQVTREVFSVKGGLKGLVDALSSSLPADALLLASEDVSIQTKAKKGFSIKLKDKSGKELTIDSERVVTTTGAYVLNNMLPFIEAEKLQAITSLGYAKVVQVAAGYKKWEGIQLDAFGGLVPSHESPQVLGMLFPSSIFPDRAPKGGALLSVFMGGIKNESLYDLSDDSIKKIALLEIKSMLGMSQTPDMVRVCRYPYAIAQYDATSEARLACIEKLEKEYPGLHLAGNIRDGIGMSDRVKQAVDLANCLS